MELRYILQTVSENIVGREAHIYRDCLQGDSIILQSQNVRMTIKLIDLVEFVEHLEKTKLKVEGETQDEPKESAAPCSSNP